MTYKAPAPWRWRPRPPLLHPTSTPTVQSRPFIPTGFSAASSPTTTIRLSSKATNRCSSARSMQGRRGISTFWRRGAASVQHWKRLIELAQTDMGDFITFEFAGSKPIKVEDEYRSGLSVGFAPIIGAKRMQQIAIDLVTDEIPLESAELITPADRTDVAGLQACDYLACSVESALADKLCASVQKRGGRSSSRVKDLVDIAIYATACSVDGGQTAEAPASQSGHPEDSPAEISRRSRRLERISRTAVQEAVLADRAG